MSFWDTSALVPLLVDEPTSAKARDLARRDPSLVVWWGTPVECASALLRRENEGSISTSRCLEARAALELLRQEWIEVMPSSVLRRYASTLLLRHRLRAADAFQLAAALVWAEGQPNGHRLATFDKRLAQAARLEGFELVTFV